MKQLGFARRYAARICFDRPFCKRREIEPLMETSEQKFQLRSCESRWRAAAEVDCFRRQRKHAGIADRDPAILLRKIATFANDPSKSL